jgi:hypothetical protein
MADSNIVCSNLVARGVVDQVVFTWDAVDTSELRSLPQMALDKFEIWMATTNNRNLASKVGEDPGNQFAYKPPSTATRFYWVRARDLSGNFGDFFPLSATGGVQGASTSALPPPNSIEEDMIQPGAVTKNKIAADAVTADKIDVNNLAAISATLGNVVVNGNLIVNGTITTPKIGTQQVTRGDTVTVSGQANLTRGLQSFCSATVNSIPAGAAVNIVASVVIGWHAANSSAFGNVDLWVTRDGTRVGSKKTVKVDDSWAGLQTWAVTDNSPVSGAEYEVIAQATQDGATLEHYAEQGTIQWLLCQR